MSVFKWLAIFSSFLIANIVMATPNFVVVNHQQQDYMEFSNSTFNSDNQTQNWKFDKQPPLLFSLKSIQVGDDIGNNTGKNYVTYGSEQDAKLILTYKD